MHALPGAWCFAPFDTLAGGLGNDFRRLPTSGRSAARFMALFGPKGYSVRPTDTPSDRSARSRPGRSRRKTGCGRAVTSPWSCRRGRCSYRA